MTHIPFTARALLVIAAGLDEIRWYAGAPARWARRSAEPVTYGEGS